MNEVMIHEKGLAQFLTSDKRRRFLRILEKKNHEKHIRDLLDHDIEIDNNFSEIVYGVNSNPLKIIEKLKELGAPKEAYYIHQIVGFTD